MRTKLSKKRREEIMKQFGGRIPTKEEVFERIKASQERLMKALQGAYETAPNDPDVKKDLVNAIDKSVKLRSAIYKKLMKTKPPKLNKSNN